MAATDTTLYDALRIKLTPYIPHVPHEKQHAYLWLDECFEALFGGAAGAGTEAYGRANSRRAAEARKAGALLKPGDGTIRETYEIAESVTVRGGRRNHSIDNAEPLVLPHADLPVDPYVLGCWLGDG